MKSNNNNKGTTKNCDRRNGSDKPSNCRTKNSGSNKTSSNKQESESDPDGSYTGNPAGWGEYAEPVVDVDDL